MRDSTTKDSTKHRIIEAGATLMHQNGYTGTGIQEVLTACGVPKGSFYHYFKSKEDFALAVVDYHAERMLTLTDDLFANTALGPLDRLRHFFQLMIDRLADCEHPLGRSGCPIGNLVQELAPSTPAMRERLDQVMTGMEIRMAMALRQAHDLGEIPARLDPDETARFISSSWQGAILRAKAAGDVSPLIRTRDFILKELLS
jgi:Transcriptional regulator